MRHFFRMHLLTGLVAMFTAAGLLWLNMRPQPTGASALFQFPAAQPGGALTVVVTPYEHFGWPWRMKDARRNDAALRVANSGETNFVEALAPNDDLDRVISALEEDGPVKVSTLPPPTVLSEGH